MDETYYSLSEVAKAAGVEPNTVRSWIQRKHFLLLDSDRPAEVNGLGHRLSLRSGLYLGAMAALVRALVPAEVAGRAALVWVHTGEEGRDPGGLFADGMTVLTVFPDESSLVRWVHPQTTWRDSFVGIDGLFKSEKSGEIILNFVDKAVRTSLAEIGATKGERRT